jgi:hypothetical protein
MSNNQEVKCIQDVLDAFDVDSEKMMSRRVYKSTDCGAWASFGKKDVTSKVKWSVSYAKIEGIWQILSCAREGIDVELSSMSKSARDYFWNDPDEVAEFLESSSGGATHVEFSNEVDEVVGHVDVFLCGSIVEGSDAEVGPYHVDLPCNMEDIWGVIKAVDSDACYLWDTYHNTTDEEDV